MSETQSSWTNVAKWIGIAAVSVGVSHIVSNILNRKTPRATRRKKQGNIKSMTEILPSEYEIPAND
jgi:hypothetical protein